MTADPSALPQRERGTRSRAGNAMARTRAAVLDGAVRAVEKYGVRRTTMADIAALAGVAKGTLYNHFRTKDAVLGAVVEHELRDLGAECAALAARSGLAPALTRAAARVSAQPALRRVATDEPAALAALMTACDGPLWLLAREQVAQVLGAAGLTPAPDTVDLALRWLLSHLAVPADGEPSAGALLVGAACHRGAEPRPDRVTSD